MNSAISPLQVIHDPPADGPANMQRDLNLLEQLTDEPILRIYGWSGNWASYGYFQKEEAVKEHFAGQKISLVKRPTGGGIVDHRQDLTYTLLLPKAHPLALVPRADCYRTIHAWIQESLDFEATHAGNRTHGGEACFLNPVPGDLLDLSGKKIAGAAQRRTRKGLLHQGSILAPIDIARLTKVFLQKLKL